MTTVYLDNNATTALDPRVLEAMLPLMHAPGNPSSQHSFGRSAKAHLTKARTSIAECLHCAPSELIFTSGGSESLSTLIHGLYRGGTILTTPLEHSSILKTVSTYPTQYCLPDQIESSISPNTSLLVFSAANGETGNLLDLEHIASLAQFHRIPLIIDAVALLGRAPLKLHPGITAMAFSGHKIHGPQGTGLIYLRSNNPLKPLIAGGAQEHGLRAGTENLPGIAGLAKAITLIDPQDFIHMQTLRDHLESGLDAQVNAHPGPRICNVSNLSFPDTDGEILLMQLDQAGIAASHGSACSSGALEPSHVLSALGYPQSRIRSSIRFSLSRTTTHSDIDHTIKTLDHLFSVSCA